MSARRAAPLPVPDALARMRAWGEARDWCGYDPYDGLNSPFADRLSLGTPLGRRLVTQVVKLSPLNLRPLLRVAPERNAKALGLVASAYIRLAAATGDETAHDRAQTYLGWLAAHHAGEQDEMAWSYPFEVQTRVFRYARGTPNAIATSFVAQAFLDAWELLGDESAAESARAAVRFLVERLLTDTGSEAYVRYLPGEGELVHNANLLACAVVARAARLSGEQSLPEPVARAVQTTLARQHADGSWAYSETPGHDWVDNFHTGYVLGALAEIQALMPEAQAPLLRGLDYWDRALFMHDGTPRYYSDRLYPIDAHCFATAIETWVAVRDLDPRALERAEREAALLIERMLDPAGFVHFQRRRWGTSKVPLIRWTTAPSFCALAGLVLAHSARASVAAEVSHARLA